MRFFSKYHIRDLINNQNLLFSFYYNNKEALILLFLMRNLSDFVLKETLLGDIVILFCPVFE